MSEPLSLTLNEDERATLRAARDHHPKAYARERAAALLKYADGTPAKHIARSGLLRTRDEETVAAWVRRYLAVGLAGLRVRPGRGREPAFSPSPPLG
jgi:hypothetical protein